MYKKHSPAATLGCMTIQTAVTWGPEVRKGFLAGQNTQYFSGLVWKCGLDSDKYNHLYNMVTSLVGSGRWGTQVCLRFTGGCFDACWCFGFCSIDWAALNCPADWGRKRVRAKDQWPILRPRQILYLPGLSAEAYVAGLRNLPSFAETFIFNSLVILPNHKKKNNRNKTRQMKSSSLLHSFPNLPPGQPNPPPCLWGSSLTPGFLHAFSIFPSLSAAQEITLFYVMEILCPVKKS